MKNGFPQNVAAWRFLETHINVLPWYGIKVNTTRNEWAQTIENVRTNILWRQILWTESIGCWVDDQDENINTCTRIIVVYNP